MRRTDFDFNGFTAAEVELNPAQKRLQEKFGRLGIEVVPKDFEV